MKILGSATKGDYEMAMEKNKNSVKLFSIWQDFLLMNYIYYRKYEMSYSCH